MLEWRLVVSIQYLKDYAHFLIDIENYIIWNTLQNFHFGEYSILVYQVGLETPEPNIGKIFKPNIIVFTKYLTLNWKIVKSFIFYQKKTTIKMT